MIGTGATVHESFFVFLWREYAANVASWDHSWRIPVNLLKEDEIDAVDINATNVVRAVDHFSWIRTKMTSHDIDRGLEPVSILLVSLIVVEL